MKRKASDYIIDIFIFFVLFLLCIVCLYPYLNQLAMSLNEGTDTTLGGLTVYPRKFTLDNYKTLFSDNSYVLAFVITISRAILTTVFQIVVVFSAAYALTRKNLVGRKFFTIIFTIPAYISAGLIPTYIVYRTLGLMNNFWVYVIPFGFSFYNMIIVRSFIQEIPDALEESALLDGANEVQILFKIIIPLSLPVLATIALWILVGQWNDWTTTLYYITNKNLYTVQYVMMKVIKQGEQIQQQALVEAGGIDTEATTTTESVKAAMIMATSIPIIIVYPFLQKYFVKGVTVGAVKG